MIVKANSSDELYQKLFEKANELLGYTTEEQKIHNIAEYFADFGNIVAACELKEQDGENTALYFILPADEDFFEIDANKRLITVPAIFQKNGASVVGDQAAEILYFTIDRYFDTMDFASTDMKIEIQALTPNGEKLLYKAYNATADYPRQEGKLVFGWPLDAECTKAKGTIQFSVRFFKEKNGKLIYSFNTLTTQIKINDSLNFDVTGTSIEVIDKSEMIRGRIHNSPLANTLPAAKPSLAPIKKIGNQIIKSINDGKSIVDLDNKLFAKAWFLKSELDEEKKQRGADFRYDWSFVPFSSDRLNTKVSEISWFLTGDATYDERDRYYYGENKELYIGEQAEFNQKKDNLYEKFSFIEYNDAGVYSVKALNIAGRGSQKDSDEAIFIVPGAAKIEATIDSYLNNLNEESPAKIELRINKINPEDEREEIGTTEVTWQKDDVDITLEKDNTDGKYKVNEEGWYKCKVRNELNNTDFTSEYSNPCRVTYPASEIKPKEEIQIISKKDSSLTSATLSFNNDILINADRSDTITYQWQMSASAKEDYKDIEGATENTLVVTENGHYKCLITNHYNNSSKSGETSIEDIFF